MKKLFVIIIFFLLMLGCESGVKYEYDIIKNVGVNVISDQDIILIDSHEELTEVFDSERFYTSSVELREKADFDSSYFEDYYLILIFINVQDLLTSYSLKSVQVNNDVLTIVIKAEILKKGLDIKSDWGVILQIPKTLEFSTISYTIESWLVIAF